jgi:UDP-GlcNAc:undecaprenyl-phosphate/decaprenyl-phosphate GlcNAc-1-phosphate transferase
VSTALSATLVPALVSFAVAVATAPLWERRLRGPGWIDLPRPGRFAKRSVSRAGGAAWLSGLLAGFAGVLAFTAGAAGVAARERGSGPASGLPILASNRFLAGAIPVGILGLVAVLAFFLGRLDDRDRLRPGRKWALQTVVLTLGALGLFLAAGLRGPSSAVGSEVARFPVWTGTSLSPLATALVVAVVLQVALEILDHLDGLVAIQAVAATACMAFAAGPGWAREAGLAACGASLGFFCWNRPPARLYLGNGGSLAVATVVPLMFVALAAGGAAGPFPGPGPAPESLGLVPGPMHGPTGVSLWRFAAVLPVFAWPIFDLLVVTVSRLSRGDPPWRGGCDHLAHRLARRLGSDRAAFAVVAVGVAAGFLLAATGLR